MWKDEEDRLTFLVVSFFAAGFLGAAAFFSLGSFLVVSFLTAAFLGAAAFFSLGAALASFLGAAAFFSLVSFLGAAFLASLVPPEAPCQALVMTLLKQKRAATYPWAARRYPSQRPSSGPC